MSRTLDRRLKKLETVMQGEDNERLRRIANGTCPDCGHEHGYLPTSGGAWRCLACSNRFTLRPGPACTQSCPVEGGHGCNARQIPMAPAPGHEEWFANFHAGRAIEDIRDSMAPEHLALVGAWERAHCSDGEPVGLPGEDWHAILERWKPPALVRAVWMLINHHVVTCLSVSLPPVVAEVYLSDPDSYPMNPCDGCGYPMPARAKLKPDGIHELLPGRYMGECPVCGLDNHPEEAEDA